jgi:hypothetical protein
MDFYKLQKEAIESYVLCFNFFFEKVRGCQRCSIVVLSFVLASVGGDWQPLQEVLRGALLIGVL